MRNRAYDTMLEMVAAGALSDILHAIVHAIEALLIQADAAMFQAKESGRNRVCLSSN